MAVRHVKEKGLKAWKGFVSHKRDLVRRLHSIQAEKDRVRVRGMFEIWRGEVQEKQRRRRALAEMTAEHVLRLKKEYLGKWIRAWRLRKSLEATRMALLGGVMERWKRRIRYVTILLEAQRMTVAHAQRRRILKESFEGWKKRARKIEAKRVVAEDALYHRILRRYMGRWKGNTLKWQMAMAVYGRTWEEERTRIKCWGVWKDRTATRVNIREEVALRNAREVLDRRKVGVIFEGWKILTKRRMRLDILLQVSEVQMQEVTLISVPCSVSGWKARQLNESVAEAKMRRKFLRRSIGEWRVQARNASARRQALIRLRHARLMERQKRIIRAWRAWTRDRALLRAREDLFGKGLERQKMGIVLSAWWGVWQGRRLRILEKEFAERHSKRVVRWTLREWRQGVLEKKAYRFLISSMVSRCWNVWRERHQDVFYEKLADGVWVQRTVGCMFYRWMWRYRHRAYDVGNDSFLSEFGGEGANVTQLVAAKYEKVAFNGNPSDFLRMTPLERALHTIQPLFFYLPSSSPTAHPPSSPTRRLQPPTSPRKTRQPILTSLFNEWHHFADLRKFDLQKASTIHIAHVKYRSFIHWRNLFLKHLRMMQVVSRVRALWNARSVRSDFLTWLELSRLRRRNREAAEVFCDFVRVRRAVRVWRGRCGDVRDMESVAEVAWRWKVLEAWFGVWRVEKERMAAGREEERVLAFVGEWRERKVLERGFDGLKGVVREGRKRGEEAGRVFVRARLGSMFRRWREKVDVRIVERAKMERAEEFRVRRLKGRVLGCLKGSRAEGERLEEVERAILSRKRARWFILWLARSRRKELLGRRVAALQEFMHGQWMRALAGYFGAWRIQTHKTHNLENARRMFAHRLATRNGLNSLDFRGSRVGMDDPDRVRRLLVLRKTLALWRKRLRNESVAREFCWGWALRRGVRQWKEWSVEEKAMRQARETALITVREGRARKMCFKIWFRRYSERIREERRRRLLRLIFAKWRDWARMRRLARRVVMVRVMRRWVDGVGAKEELLDLASQQHDDNVTKRCFDSWRRALVRKRDERHIEFRRSVQREAEERVAKRVNRLDEMGRAFGRRRLLRKGWSLWRMEWKKRRFEEGRKEIFADTWAETALKRRVLRAWIDYRIGLLSGSRYPMAAGDGLRRPTGPVR
ncbi:hypothetical protein HK097_008067 [Rhizophlyctis rosea]|uniref:Sfi1 spindle body domain-containing protein n=1 Tax=Rhizophlyctis rosea TaxID=64517 RepID=A0AAD5SD25_9FUNG|nr:hypothetical protein HK097_008067 [Rhizophlyctis rosea]